jgi:transposase
LAVETGTHSRWVSQTAEAAGLEVLVGNARKLRAIWKSPQKSDVRDAEMLARIARMDPALLSPIRHRSAQAQQDLAIIKARDALVRTRASLIAHVRGVVKGFGHRLASSGSAAFAAKAKLPEALQPALGPLLETVKQLTAQIDRYDRLIAETALRYPETTHLIQVQGVGLLTAMAFVLSLEEPGRFEDSRMVGAYLGLVPRRDQSGQTDKQLPITKAGNTYLRRLLVGCAHYILGPFGKACDLRRHGEAIMARGGKNAKKRAAVAVARKLAVLLHVLWREQTIYEPDRRLTAMA